MRTTGARGAFRVATQRRSVKRWQNSASRGLKRKALAGSRVAVWSDAGVPTSTLSLHLNVLPTFASKTPVLTYNLHGVLSQYQRCDKLICSTDNGKGG
jgi:hypothetical protein